MAETTKKAPGKGNGGETSRYVWTQTLSDVVVTIPVPASLHKKLVDCRLTKTSLALRLKDDALATTFSPLEGNWDAPIAVDESYWQLDSDEHTLTLYLEKIDKMNWWACVLKNDDHIDVQMINPENSNLASLDPETKAMVEKMMFDQRQKAAGKPTSEEIQRQNMLKKIMEQNPGLDFSKANIQ